MIEISTAQHEGVDDGWPLEAPQRAANEAQVSPLDRWTEENNRYLAASLHWLRLKLRRLASSDDASASDAALAEALRRREDAAQMHPPPALILLAERIGLSAFERDTLLLCAAAELDPSAGTLLRAAQGSEGRSFPTFALAMQVLDEPAWDAVSPHRPLRSLRLVDVSRAGAAPLTACPLRADERIVSFIKGLNYLDERMALLATSADEEGPAMLSASQRRVADSVLELLRAATVRRTTAVIRLVGSDVGSKLALAEHVGVQLGRRVHRIAAESIPSGKGELESFLRLWERESVLLPLALYIDADDIDNVGSETAAALREVTARASGLVFVALREASAGGLASALTVHVEKPTRVEQREIWDGLLDAALASSDRHDLARRLAGQFDFNAREIHRCADMVLHDDSRAPLRERLWQVCRSSTQPRLDLLAHRIMPKASFGDLVLSAESVELLRQIVGQVRERYRVYEEWGYSRRLTRGLGISALFVGESGTGKTTAAEVLARELDLSLYRIDLSAVVSKYIGETEKNLRQLFDAAEQGGAILFFDEADALFGKRGEVKDSHDRYANVEINYLLQRMESFAGLAILATNMKAALDPAFMRRLRFVVHFQFPSATERKLIWQRVLPPGVPSEGLDFDRLARFHLSGGNIQSVALNAAFLAAQRAKPVTSDLVMSAVRAELRKLEKPIHEKEFL